MNGQQSINEPYAAARSVSDSDATVTDEEWKKWKEERIARFETENFPLKYKRYRKREFAEFLWSAILKFPKDCQNCDDVLDCAAHVLEFQVNESSARDFKKEQRKQKRVDKLAARAIQEQLPGVMA